eukprot:CAMPEP_0178401434 /NCGR_PEP_ID=MMETSP0689_2-20121128/16300_1 /TAXON_ID=160604 /ORGANISM="Amphidinium massartii, Strain CS-259" /LENGTH=113 /DNA_ID=CAMNT_0020022255 /DNA_START=76 /DNA_END=417 /DNA_ORIENTATION=+
MAVLRTSLLVLASLLAGSQARIGMPLGLIQTDKMEVQDAAAMMDSNITQTAGMEGVACTPGDMARYVKIVCSVEAACGCAETRCELDWCAEYVHEWKKDFGACTLTACPSKGE